MGWSQTFSKLSGSHKLVAQECGGRFWEGVIFAVIRAPHRHVGHRRNKVLTIRNYLRRLLLLLPILRNLICDLIC